MLNLLATKHKTLSHNKDEGFFVRLVGKCYFKKHLAGFVSLYEHRTLIHLFNLLDHSLDPLYTDTRSGFKLSELCEQ